MAQLFAYIVHKDAVIDDSAAELAVAAEKIEAGAQVTAIVTGSGAELDAVCQAAAKSYAQVWKFDHADLAYPNAEVLCKLLVQVLPAEAILLIAHDTLGMDLGPGLSIKLNSSYVADVVGIEDQENIEIAQELADAMGAVVSCSRPIVDAKWLEKSRQVGTSGQTVKPKVYMAMGISGSFQHLGGLKGSPFIVAVNKNPKAPIFQVSDVGIVEDILVFMPQLTEKIQ